MIEHRNHTKDDRDNEPGSFPQPGYLTTLAHELKTPLSAIVSATEVMRNESLGPLENDFYKTYVIDIYQSATYMLELVDRILKNAIRPSSEELDFTQVDINNLVDQCISSLIPLAERERQTLKKNLSPRLPNVIADSTSLKQVLLNLITNAIKYNSPNGLVNVSTHYELDGPLTISVRDNGPGISLEKADKILQLHSAPTPSNVGEETKTHKTTLTESDSDTKKYKHQSSYKEKKREEPSGNNENQKNGLPKTIPNQPITLSGGLGIGLSLVRSLTRANGANVEFFSQKGHGTIVAIIFPKDRLVPV